MKSVVLTGASSGIGEATLKLLIEKGYRVFATVRKEADAKKITELYGDKAYPLLCDIDHPEQIKSAFEQVKKSLNGENLVALINNAGFNKAVPLTETSVEIAEGLLRTNTIGPHLVTKAFLPLLGGSLDNKKAVGRVIHVGSVAAHCIVPLNTFYSMSKVALDFLSDGMNLEYAPFGIRSIVIAPGPIYTSIVDVAYDNKLEWGIYEPIRKDYLATIEKTIKRYALPADAAAKVIVKAMEAKCPKRRYIISASKLLDTWLLKLIPKSLYIKILSVFFRLKSIKT